LKRNTGAAALNNTPAARTFLTATLHATSADPGQMRPVTETGNGTAGASIQTEATSRSLVKSMHKQGRIDPNGGDKPEFGKIDA
jgi:hypothetical protein